MIILKKEKYTSTIIIIILNIRNLHYIYMCVCRNCYLLLIKYSYYFRVY